MGFPFNYVLTDSVLEVRLGSFTVRRVLYSDMEQVKRGYAFWNEHWINFLPLRYLTIRRRRGWIRNFVINPCEPEVFIEELHRKIAHKLSISPRSRPEVPECVDSGRPKPT
ncbi:MAG: PH domain-containing protein [bacterium]